MTFDESNARITSAFTGRTIEYVFRKGKELVFHTSCGHEISIQADVNGDIHFRRQGVRIVLPGVDALNEVGEFWQRRKQ